MRVTNTEFEATCEAMQQIKQEIAIRYRMKPDALKEFHRRRRNVELVKREPLIGPAHLSACLSWQNVVKQVFRY